MPVKVQVKGGIGGHNTTVHINDEAVMAYGFTYTVTADGLARCSLAFTPDEIEIDAIAELDGDDDRDGEGGAGTPRTQAVLR